MTSEIVDNGDLSVLIPARANEWRKIEGLVVGLMSQTLLPREIIIGIDGGMPPRIPVLADDHAIVKIDRTSYRATGRLGEQLNRLREAATGSNLVILTPGAFVLPDYLERVVAAIMIADELVDQKPIVQSDITHATMQPREYLSLWRALARMKHGVGDPTGERSEYGGNESREWRRVSINGMALRRTNWLDFDPALKAGQFGVADMAFRALRNGLTFVSDPTLKIIEIWLGDEKPWWSDQMDGGAEKWVERYGFSVAPTVDGGPIVSAV